MDKVASEPLIILVVFLKLESPQMPAEQAFEELCLSEKEKAALDYRSDAFFRQAWIYLTSFTSFNTSFSCSEEAV